MAHEVAWWSTVRFWVWVEDSDNNRIYHYEHVVFSRRSHPEVLYLDLSIPAFDPLPNQYYLRVVSDTWVGVEMVVPVSFKHIMMPEKKTPYTDLIDLTPLPTSALQEPKYEQLYAGYDTFNPIQTQLFPHTVSHRWGRSYLVHQRVQERLSWLN